MLISTCHSRYRCLTISSAILGDDLAQGASTEMSGPLLVEPGVPQAASRNVTARATATKNIEFVFI